ncbi:MAG: hypothetical protein KDG57_21530 [Rhodoferax sp.]|nr:hypothetical protein [Rhodoferax sp.]
MSRPYMQEPWFVLLVSQCEQRPRSAVARLLGLSPATLSQVLNASGLYGTGAASTTRIADKVVHTFGRYPCPHLTAEEGGAPQVITAEQCRAWAHRPAPTGSPRAMQHWQACRQCPHAAHTAPPQPKPVIHRKKNQEAT